MKIVYDDNLSNPALCWENCVAGEVYQSVSNPGLLALKSKGPQAYCLRESASVSLHEVWAPGRESKWVKVNALLSVSVEVL